MPSAQFPCSGPVGTQAHKGLPWHCQSSQSTSPLQSLSMPSAQFPCSGPVGTQAQSGLS